MTDVDGAISAALGSGVVTSAPVSGGDMAASFRLVLDDGRTIFAKTHSSPPLGFFTREASDLAWLTAARALPVPKVLAVSDDFPAFLALEWIEPGGRRPSTDADLGAGLASLHRAGADCFGRTDGRTTGSLALPNEPTETWAAFYAECRLLPLARIAADRNSLPTASIERIESVAGRLDELGGPVEPPARLHGDLWAGNRLVDVHGDSWLIDPASHGGHREFDLAMMRVFGGFDADAFDTYNSRFPLAVGWEARVPLHQLAPLIVHAIKFGGAYVSAVERALDKLATRGVAGV
ncbi:MAG: fructosamine kinase family protein [Ilumatobacter sp.]|uniref:fructosamine kinase family protein n=1 Tax=Ilumatobacter sp. TaxID=1967498 RepID=UPI003299A0BA